MFQYNAVDVIDGNFTPRDEARDDETCRPRTAVHGHFVGSAVSSVLVSVCCFDLCEMLFESKHTLPINDAHQVADVRLTDPKKFPFAVFQLETVGEMWGIEDDVRDLWELLTTHAPYMSVCVRFWTSD